jgi:hypothetical protein
VAVAAPAVAEQLAAPQDQQVVLQAVAVPQDQRVVLQVVAAPQAVKLAALRVCPAVQQVARPDQPVQRAVVRREAVEADR